jgi:hypothetical protein
VSNCPLKLCKRVRRESLPWGAVHGRGHHLIVLLLTVLVPVVPAGHLIAPIGINTMEERCDHPSRSGGTF